VQRDAAVELGPALGHASLRPYTSLWRIAMRAGAGDRRASAPHLAPLPIAEPAPPILRFKQRPSKRHSMNDLAARGTTRPRGRASSAAPPPPRARARSRFIIGIMLAIFLSGARADHLAPAFADDRRTSRRVENLSWVVTAYLLSATVATPLFGKLLRHLRPPPHDADPASACSFSLGRPCGWRPRWRTLILARGPCRGWPAAAPARCADRDRGPAHPGAKRPLVMGLFIDHVHAAASSARCSAACSPITWHWSLIFWIQPAARHRRPDS